jgi:hypothetical protein
MATQLDVYVESRSAFVKSADYKLQHMLRGLRRANLTCRVLDRFYQNDVGNRAFLHVDLTELPKRFREIDRHYAECVNGRAATISRLLYSRVKVAQGDAYGGPVIAKTVLNHHGWPELRFDTSRNIARRLRHALKNLVAPDYERQVCPAYRVYPSSADVPPRVWADPRLMVERFLPGHLDPPIVKHRLDFFYDVELNLRSTYASLLCDPETVMSVDTAGSVPNEVAEVRRALKLDFGAIDYFVIGNEAFVIDANKTVGITPAWVARFPAVARHVDLATERLIDFVRGDHT